MRTGVLAWILFAIPFGVRGAELTRLPGWDEREENRVYLAPGVQFGARSQELTLTLGRANVMSGTGSAGTWTVTREERPATP